MSLNDGAGDNWDETAPADGDLASVGAKEIRDVRKGVRIRLSKEHATPAADDAGGEHLPGSAMAYYGNVFPANRPDGVTPLTSDDAGRLFAASNGGLLYWDGSSWQETRIVDPFQLGDGVVTSAAVAANAITSGLIADGAVGTTELADGAVTTAKITDANVTTAKIATGNVINDHIADGTIALTKLAFTPAKVNVGTYSGNGSASPGKAVTGVGFQPDFIVIQRSDNNVVLVANRAGTNPGRLSDAALGQDTSFNGTNAISFDTDGFTILTSNIDANHTGTTYYYLAIKANS